MSEGSLLHESVEAFRLPGNLAKAPVLSTPPELSLFIGHIQRCTVQIGAEPENFSAGFVTQMANTRQRAVCFVRVVNICLALTVVLLFLQKSQALPEEAGLCGAVWRGDRFACASAQDVIMVVCRKPAFWSIAPGPYQAVFRVVYIMLFIQTTSATDEVTPPVVFHKQVLPVRQAVIPQRQGRVVIIRQQVIRSVVAERSVAVVRAGFVVPEKTAFLIIAVNCVATQGVTDVRQFSPPGIVEGAF